jgi:IS30 family transposase
MNQSNINPVKEQLRLLIETYQRPLRGKLATLAPLRDEIFALHKKGASSAEIAALLAQCQVTISKDAVARFLRVEAARERNSRAKKTAAAPQTPTPDGAPATRFTPRFPSSDQQ